MSISGCVIYGYLDLRLSGTVSVTDYTLCMRSVGLAEKVMSLTFRGNVNFLLHVPRCFCGEKRVFDEHSAHSKAVLDDSLITVDTTSLDQRASKEVTRVTLFKNFVFHSFLFLY